MRQTGLTPEIIKKLKYKDLEQTKQIPRKIEVRQFQTRREKPPVFIGEEGSVYIDRYLASRNNITPESLLFCTKKENGIDTKNLSRTFRLTFDNIVKEKKVYCKLEATNPQSKTNKRKFSIYSLIRFYQENSECYENASKEHRNESDEFYRRLYKEKAMPSLEIQSLITIRLTRKQRQTELANLDYQIKEMKQTIARDSEYISSILTLLYNNFGDYETGENIEIGDNFIELWKEIFDLQHEFLGYAWEHVGTIKRVPMLDIVDELTKTLKRLREPYYQLQRETANSNAPFHSKEALKAT